MKKRYHIVGVAGVGMGAVAEYLLASGQAVSGSDRSMDQAQALVQIDILRKQGLQSFPQDGSGVDEEVEAVIISTAVEEENADLIQAQALSIPILHRTDLIQQLFGALPLMAISGTSGKTTTSSLVAWILEEAGLDPHVLLGGSLLNWRSAKQLGSARVGEGDLCVLEADESDKSFLKFEADTALVTNISPDHFGLEESLDLFKEFLSKTKRLVILGPGIDDETADHILPANIARLHLAHKPERRGDDWLISWEGQELICPLPGYHNAENVLCAMAVCRGCGVDKETLIKALRTFQGVSRRFERVYQSDELSIYDDYAHNPEKMRAAWSTLKSKGRVLVYWRPHGFKPLAQMFADLEKTFVDLLSDSEDHLFLLPVYYAGGTVQAEKDTADLVQAIRESCKNIHYVKDYTALQQALQLELAKGDHILGMGARDPHLPIFAKGLSKVLL